MQCIYKNIFHYYGFLQDATYIRTKLSIWHKLYCIDRTPFLVQQITCRKHDAQTKWRSFRSHHCTILQNVSIRWHLHWHLTAKWNCLQHSWISPSSHYLLLPEFPKELFLEQNQCYRNGGYLEIMLTIFGNMKYFQRFLEFFKVKLLQ